MRILNRTAMQWAVALIATGILSAPVSAADVSKHQSYALIVAGDGAEPAYTETYRDWSVRLHKLLTADLGIPAANVRLLMEKQDLAPQIISAECTKENTY